MADIELIATTAFGLESVVRREIEGIGCRVLRTEDGKITYASGVQGIARSNLRLRSAERVLLKMGEFPAETSEELFQQTKALSWEEWIPPDGCFTVTCTTVKSKLRSEPACQKTVKKAIAERLSDLYMMDRLPETGASYTVKVTLLRDRATLTIDTSGTGLHQRGYRVRNVAAPMKETLAAGLVQLSFWKSGRVLIDPFCGSGTLPIEAALYERNIAPGLNRSFASQEWDAIPEKVWKAEREAAYRDIRYDRDVKILASDIDKRAVAAAKENAEEAGVDDCISFLQRDFLTMDRAPDPYSVILCNPPYGERIGDKKALQAVYQHMGTLLEQDDTLSMYVITADQTIATRLSRPADRRRKLYNGRIETCYYQYYGKRPPKAEGK